MITTNSGAHLENGADHFRTKGHAISNRSAKRMYNQAMSGPLSGAMGFHCKLPDRPAPQGIPPLGPHAPAALVFRHVWPRDFVIPSRARTREGVLGSGRGPPKIGHAHNTRDGLDHKDDHR